MKSRTSFFDKTVLKKDLTRFFPLWALYLMVGLLIMHILSGFYGDYFNDRSYSTARALNTMIGPLGILNACYAFLAAQLLFGDLHNTRLCYGVHAFPQRRECWYLTHTVSGLLMGLVPPMVIALTVMPLMGQFWFTALLCWGGIALHYLFFFGLGVLCMTVTGNRFAASAIYGILNFLSLIVLWFAKTIYIPLLPGVRADTGIFNLFSPVVALVGRDDFFQVMHLDTCPCHDFTNTGGYVVETWYDGIQHQYGFMGLGGDWGYLWILAGVGIALLAGGTLLYRIRHLERAGDFMAFKPMKPLFLAVYSLCVGAVLFYLAEEAVDIVAGYLFFVIGLFLGYFTGKMLLERNIRVFKGKSWAGLGILYAAVALSLLLTWVDPIGISRRIPKADKVEKIMLHDGRLSDYRLGTTADIVRYEDVIFITEEGDIAAFSDTHRLLLEAHSQNSSGNAYSPVTLQYWMKNGSRITRTYYVPYQGEAYKQFVAYLAKPEYFFGTDSLEALKQQVNYLYLDSLGEVPEDLYASLLEAIWLDAQEGTLAFSWKGDGKYYVELQTDRRHRTLFFGSEAKHLTAWIEEYETAPQLLLRSETLDELLDKVQSVSCPDLGYSQKGSNSTLITQLWKDCQNGLVHHANSAHDGIYLEIDLGNKLCILVVDKRSFSYSMLVADSLFYS